MSKYLEWAKREWPASLAILVLVVGNVWLYGIQGADWHPASAPLLIAVLIFFGGELLRKFIVDPGGP